MRVPLFRSLGIILMLLFGVVVPAQDITAHFPTVQALAEAEIPPRDLLDLAQRLEGVGSVLAAPEVPPAYAVGAVDTFWATNSYEDRSFQVEAELRVIGEHVYLWVEQGESVPLAGLQQLADAFDQMVYDKTRGLWGSEPSPGVDGDRRVHGLFVRDLGAGVGAYFAAKHTYPREAVPTSNQREMFFYNLDAIEGLIGTPRLTTITAHEFQHMIRSNVDSNEDGWMDEGFSTFTEVFLGDQDLFTLMSFLNAPNTQLNTWTENGNRIPDYGASQMWVTYLYERFGIEGLNALSRDPANGLVAVDNLAQAYDTDANTLFADWVLANLILNPDKSAEGIYGYRTYTGLTGPQVTTISALPITQTLEVNQYASHYSAMTHVDGIDTLQIEVSAPSVARLAPTDSPSNTPMWYSNRGDDSDTYLTFPLDLTGLQEPTLAYRLWYHIENLWDYAYVMVSTDGGTTWELLEASGMTRDNPHFTAYGSGYTGISGGGAVSDWIDEQVSLKDYAGQTVLIRFEMIYDDAVNQPGVFVDQVELIEGANGERVYRNDFSDPEALGDWVANGWVWTDNRLPQQVWIQAVQRIGDFHTVTRWRLTAGSESYTLALDPNATQVFLVISPFAPVTTTPANVQLTISAQ